MMMMATVSVIPKAQGQERDAAQAGSKETQAGEDHRDRTKIDSLS